MSAGPYGKGLRIGVNNVGSSAFSTDAIMQSYDSSITGDEIEIKNGQGEVVAWYGANKKTEATWAYYVASSTLTVSASIVKPDFGSMITITANAGSDITGSNWIVKSVDETATNTDAVKISVKATRYPLITAA